MNKIITASPEDLKLYYECIEGIKKSVTLNRINESVLRTYVETSPALTKENYKELITDRAIDLLQIEAGVALCG